VVLVPRLPLVDDPPEDEGAGVVLVNRELDEVIEGNVFEGRTRDDAGPEVGTSDDADAEDTRLDGAMVKSEVEGVRVEKVVGTPETEGTTVTTGMAVVVLDTTSVELDAI